MPSPLPRRRSNRNLRIFRKEPCWKSTVEAGPARLAVRAISRHPHSSTPCCDAARGARRRWRPREGAKTDVAAAAVARVGRARLQAFRALSETGKSARCGASQRGGVARGARGRGRWRERHRQREQAVWGQKRCGSFWRRWKLVRAGVGDGGAAALARRSRHPPRALLPRGRGHHALPAALRAPRALAGAWQGRSGLPPCAPHAVARLRLRRARCAPSHTRRALPSSSVGESDARAVEDGACAPGRAMDVRRGS